MSRPPKSMAVIAAAIIAYTPLAAQSSPAPHDTTATKDSIPPKPEFKPSWNFSAWMFGTFQHQTDSATKAKNNGSAFSKFTVDRAYLTFKGQVAPDFGFRVTTDVLQSAAASGYAGLVVRLKFAYVQWDYLHAANPTDWSAWARIGQIHTVVIDEEERFWPRWMQKTPLEYWGYQVSSDLGASTQFQLPDKLGWGYLTVQNGGGYTVAESDRYKDGALRLSLTPLAKGSGLFKNLEVTGWYLAGLSPASVLTQPGLKRDRYGATVESLDPRLTFSLEWAEMTNQVDSVGPPYGKYTVTSPLVDGFVVVRPFLFRDPKGVPLGVVARYDKFTPNNGGATSGQNETLFLLGVFSDSAKLSSFGLSYQQTTPHSGATGPYKTAITNWMLNWQLTF